MALIFDLDRFIAAQAPVMETVRSELIVDEAKAYLAHPVLGPRLLDCTALVNRITRLDAYEIFGSPDDLKCHSCITLFSRADPNQASFKDALNRFFDGQPDPKTLELI
jgi:uncharacterized protein (DUF1810 family)